MQIGPEAADQRVVHARFDHRRPQIDRAAGLRIASGEVEARGPFLDGDGDGDILWHNPIGVIAVLIVGSLVSLMTKPAAVKAA